MNTTYSGDNLPAVGTRVEASTSKTGCIYTGTVVGFHVEKYFVGPRHCKNCSCSDAERGLFDWNGNTLEEIDPRPWVKVEVDECITFAPDVKQPEPGKNSGTIVMFPPECLTSL